MRTATLTLIVAGVALLTVALWLATVMPIRSDVVSFKNDQVEGTHTLHRNLWGTPVRKSSVHLYRPENGRTREVQQEGGVMGAGNEHGRWNYRDRYNEGEWEVNFHWYIDGRLVTEEEWNEYCRRR